MTAKEPWSRWDLEVELRALLKQAGLAKEDFSVLKVVDLSSPRGCNWIVRFRNSSVEHLVRAQILRLQERNLE